MKTARGPGTLFDFEACGVGPWVYDLACYWRKRIGLMTVGELHPQAGFA